MVNAAMGDLEVEVLAKAMESNDTITHLNFSSNKCGIDGTKALGRALLRPQMRSIMLRNCQLGDEGAEILASSMSNSPIETLVLTGNQVCGCFCILVWLSVPILLHDTHPP